MHTFEGYNKGIIMRELNEILKEDFINASRVAATMQPEKESRIAANTVRKRVVQNKPHPPAEVARIAAQLALLKSKIEIFLEKSMQKT